MKLKKWKRYSQFREFYPFFCSSFSFTYILGKVLYMNIKRRSRYIPTIWGDERKSSQGSVWKMITISSTCKGSGWGWIFASRDNNDNNWVRPECNNNTDIAFLSINKWITSLRYVSQSHTACNTFDLDKIDPLHLRDYLFIINIFSQFSQLHATV